MTSEPCRPAGLAVALLCACGTVMETPDGGVDTSPPTIAATQPADGAQGLSPSTTIVIEFSEAMDPESLVVSAAPEITFDLDWPEAMTATLAPRAPLAAETLHTLTVMASDAAGNPLAGSASFAFTTGASDETPPALLSSSPVDQATGVDPATSLVLTFSEPMAVGSVTASAEPPVDLGPAAWSGADTVVTFRPTSALPAGALVAVSLVGQDRAGNPLPETTVRFTTALPPDGAPPAVVVASPVGASVAPNSILSVTFDEEIVAAANPFQLNPPVSCAHVASGRNLTCMPSAPFAGGTTYQVTVQTSVRDLAGNLLAAPYTWSFTTAAAPDTTPPTVLGFTPAADATGVPRATAIEVAFSEAMNRVTTESAFRVSVNGGSFVALPGTFAWSGATMAFQPAAPFAYGDQVRWRVAATATDEAGNALGAAVSRAFTVIRQDSAVLTSAAALDGYVRENQTVSAAVTYINVGDRSDGLAVYGYVSFDTSRIPANAVITSAVLTVYQTAVYGAPYGSGSLGVLRAERVDYGGTLDGADFSVPASPDASVVLSNDAGLGPRSVQASSLAGGCAGAARCQFRLRFTRDTESPASDGAYDYVSVAAAEDSVASQRPTLRITWEYP